MGQSGGVSRDKLGTVIFVKGLGWKSILPFERSYAKSKGGNHLWNMKRPQIVGSKSAQQPTGGSLAASWKKSHERMLEIRSRLRKAVGAFESTGQGVWR